MLSCWLRPVAIVALAGRSRVARSAQNSQTRRVPCVHLATRPDPEPAPSSAEGCTDCLSAGTAWVHLRLCEECGNVGCCDSSPMKHASAHFHASGHPVIRSFEPGESWLWCYVDEEVA
jgi:monovalent cation/hydrogen antiporter